MSSRKNKSFFSFCPVCAGRLAPKYLHGATQPVCRGCGFVFYQNSKPTASAILVDKKGRVLLTRRGIKPKLGWWDLPGGFLENGEDPIIGLKREIKEELGVKIRPTALVGVYVDRYFFGYHFYTFNLNYEAEIISGRIKPMDDVADYRWFDQRKIPWSKMAFRNGRLALKDWLKSK